MIEGDGIFTLSMIYNSFALAACAVSAAGFATSAVVAAAAAAAPQIEHLKMFSTEYVAR